VKPRGLKPRIKTTVYRSGEPLRHPKNCSWRKGSIGNIAIRREGTMKLQIPRGALGMTVVSEAPAAKAASKWDSHGTTEVVPSRFALNGTAEAAAFPNMLASPGKAREGTDSRE
jgi:hypothetical protein